MKTNELKCTDLRIGNYLKYNNKIVNVFGLRPRYIEYYDEDEFLVGDNPEYFEPIELTEEVLLKVGFDKCDEDMNIYAFESGIAIVVYVLNRELLIIEGVENNVLIDRNIRLNNTKYIHQLQNVYHLLTGKELEVKL